MELQPMIHVEAMTPAVAFYEALGAQINHGSQDGDFVMMTLGGASFSLLAHPPNPDQNEGVVELNFVSDQSLEVVEQRLRGVGIRVASSAQNTGFGRQLQVVAPDGLLVKINWLDRDRYA